VREEEKSEDMTEGQLLQRASSQEVYLRNNEKKKETKGNRLLIISV